jgi:DNA-directed RNA polymerase specialized sigma subunit
MLDKRLIEKADVWINVIEPGLAVVHEITVEDYSGDINRIPKEELTWPDISQHPLKLSLDRAKARLVEEGEEFNQDQGEVVDVDKKLKEQRDELIRGIYESTDVTQKQIGQVVGVTARQVSNIVNAD